MQSGFRWLPIAVLVLPLLGASGPGTAGPPSGDTMEMRGMTFAASEGQRNEILLRAERAQLDARAEVAHLEGVRVQLGGAVADPDALRFEMTCEAGSINLATSDFEAHGNVRGRTADGRRFATDWIRYDDARGVAYTDAGVEIHEGSVRFRGEGLRYHVRENRLQLLKAHVVQTP